MNKQLVRYFLIPGIVLAIAGGILGGTNPSSGSLIGILLYAVGTVLNFIALIGSLIKAAQLNRWGWFVGILLGLGIGLLLWVFIGPETKRA